MAQLRADVLGRAVRLPAHHAVTLLGAAILAAAGGGLHAGVGAAAAAMSRQERVYQPDPSRSTAYEAAFRRWQVARDALWNAQSGGRAEEKPWP